MHDGVIALLIKMHVTTVDGLQYQVIEALFFSKLIIV